MSRALASIYCAFVREEWWQDSAWIPKCEGGAAYGPHGCSCDTAKNRRREARDWEVAERTSWQKKERRGRKA